MGSETHHRELQLEALTNAPPHSLLDDPIEYIFADHFRQRTLCNVLDDLANASAKDIELIQAAIDFLKGDFELHIQDEEENLFPLLKRLVDLNNGFQDVLKQLHEEHRADHIDAKQIVEKLEAYLSNSKLQKTPAELEKLLQRFADNERRHLTTENAIVLPIARSKLSRTTLAELGKKMAARRKSIDGGLL